MGPVYETLTAPSCLPGHEPQLLLHRKPRHSSWPPNSTLKTRLKEQPWVGQLQEGGEGVWGGVGHGTATGKVQQQQQQKQHLSSAAPRLSPLFVG